MIELVKWLLLFSTASEFISSLKQLVPHKLRFALMHCGIHKGSQAGCKHTHSQLVICFTGCPSHKKTQTPTAL